MEKKLIELLKEKNISESLIDAIIDSGYFVTSWMGSSPDQIVETVRDKMYGNKGFSSSFEIENFIEYAKGNYEFEKFRGYRSFRVKTKAEINEILNDSNRSRYINNGMMSFRGQTKEYHFKRKIPNPFRKDSEGKEISILPGALRNKHLGMDPKLFTIESGSFSYLLRELEPKNPNVNFDSFASRDIMHVEQHYAKQTAGLDISFDIETALFFSTYKFNLSEKGVAYHTKVERGKHEGVIYCFVFRDPPVRKTQFLIEKFNLFKSYTPERILRQKCGLPLFSDYDRNIALCDIDCIIYLDENFDYDTFLTPQYMFPNEINDKFYGKLMELKRKYTIPHLDNILEYGN